MPHHLVKWKFFKPNVNHVKKITKINLVDNIDRFARYEYEMNRQR